MCPRAMLGNFLVGEKRRKFLVKESLSANSLISSVMGDAEAGPELRRGKKAEDDSLEGRGQPGHCATQEPRPPLVP